MADKSKEKESQPDDKESDGPEIIVDGTAIVLLVVFTILILGPLLSEFFFRYGLIDKLWTNLGTYGDYFGSLFNAGALIFLGWSFYYQKREIRLQRKEFEKSVEMFKAQQKEMADQNALNRNTEIARQRGILFGMESGPSGKYIRQYAMQDLHGMRSRRFSNVDLNGLDISHFDLRDCDLENSNLANSDMFRTNFEGANLKQVALISAKASQVILTGASLQSADLRNANMFKANLEGADLSGAVIGIDDNDVAAFNDEWLGANLERANFRYADLTDSILNLADLRNADLRGANLTRASFTGASVEGAKIDHKWRTQIEGYHGNPKWFDETGREVNDSPN